MNNFKTKPIAGMTPSILLAQASELKWKGIIVIGILENQEGDDPNLVKTCMNFVGLKDTDLVFLASRLSYTADQVHNKPVDEVLS